MWWIINHMQHACIMLQVLYVLDLTFHLQLIISVIIIRFSGFHFIFRLNLTEQRGAKTFHSAFKILIIHRYDWISKVCSYVDGIQLKIFDASKNIWVTAHKVLIAVSLSRLITGPHNSKINTFIFYVGTSSNQTFMSRHFSTFVMFVSTGKFTGNRNGCQ